MHAVLYSKLVDGVATGLDAREEGAAVAAVDGALGDDGGGKLLRIAHQEDLRGS